MRFILLTILLSLPMLLFAAPGIPHQLYGTVEDFTDGTLHVLIDGTIVASTPIQSDGTFGENPNLLFITDSNGTFAGKVMTFKINSAEADEHVTFVNGGITELATRLHHMSVEQSAPAAPSTPAPTQVVIVTPSIVGDLNHDGSVDVLDFNIFIAQWGAPLTDINTDGVVNALDFNILMANWS